MNIIEKIKNRKEAKFSEEIKKREEAKQRTEDAFFESLDNAFLRITEDIKIPERQKELQKMSLGETEEDRRNFMQLLGVKDYPFQTATTQERNISVLNISRKEGWRYIRKDLIRNEPPITIYPDPLAWYDTKPYFDKEVNDK